MNLPRKLEFLLKHYKDGTILENYQQKEHHRGIGFIQRTTY
ncbi:hypothetical protein NSP_43480 [Nodularia spumigena CCY9414]|nr:hypothetical protein NSP_43480 [Nodularia spumigena CCY9414]